MSTEVHNGRPKADLPENEAELVRRSQADPAEFGPLFDFYAPRVYRYALHRLGNVADAEDVTSRTFQDALQGINRYRPSQKGSFGGWLFTIARRRCADYFRTAEFLPLSLFNFQDNNPGPVAEAIAQDDQRRLGEILKALSEKERELLRLRFAGQLSYREIGQVSGKTEAAAKMSLTRLLQKMRKTWEENDG